MAQVLRQVSRRLEMVAGITAAIVLAGCSTGTPGSSCDCPWLGDWTGTLSWLHGGASGWTPGPDLHVAFTVGSCSGADPAANFVQANFTKASIDQAGFGPAAHDVPNRRSCQGTADCDGFLHVPIHFPAGPAPMGPGYDNYSWDWALELQNAGLAAGTQEAPLSFSRTASGIHIAAVTHCQFAVDCAWHINAGDPAILPDGGLSHSNEQLFGLSSSEAVLGLSVDLQQVSTPTGSDCLNGLDAGGGPPRDGGTRGDAGVPKDGGQGGHGVLPDGGPLPAPTGLTVTQDGGGQLTLTWQPVVSATFYNVYIATQSGVSQSNYGSLPGGRRVSVPTPPLSESGFLPGSTYYFVVSAINPTGESPDSSPVSAALPCSAPYAMCQGQCVNTAMDTAHCGSACVDCAQGVLNATGVSCAQGACTYASCQSGQVDCDRNRANGCERPGTTCAVTLATGQAAPTGIAVDESFLYWANSGDGTVWKVPLDGGASTPIASSQGTVQDVAVDPTNVYWVRSGVGIAAESLSGGVPWSFAPGQVPDVLGTGSGNLYWADLSHGVVIQAPADGGPWARFDAGASGFGSNVFGTAANASFVYYSVVFTPPGAVFRVPLDGGPPQKIATGLWPYGLALDSNWVYWTEHNNYALMATPLDGGATVTIAPGNAPTTLVRADDAGVYWVDQGSGNVWMLPFPLDGGAPISLASGQAPTGLCIDSRFVYWTNKTQGTVVKAPK